MLSLRLLTYASCCCAALALSGCLAPLQHERADADVEQDPEGPAPSSTEPDHPSLTPGPAATADAGAPPPGVDAGGAASKPTPVLDASAVVTPISTSDAGAITPEPDSGRARPALPGAPASSSSSWTATQLTELDAYALARSIEQLASLEVQRAGTTLFKRAQAEIQQFVPAPGFHLTALELKRHWLDTFWAWSSGQSSSPNADAVRIASALASYLVGVSEINVGLECERPLNYLRDYLAAGVPGDDAAKRLQDAIARSEQGAETQQWFDAGSWCRTTLRPLAAATPVAVVIELPSGESQAVGDTAVYTLAGDGSRARVGVPAPLLGTRRRDQSFDTYGVVGSARQLASLTLRRDGVELLRKSRAEIMQAAPTPGGSHLTEFEFREAWLSAVRAWFAPDAPHRLFDSVRVVGALTTQFVGVSQVSYGPECGPISGSYMYGSIAAGVPGDDAPARTEAEVARAEAEIRRFMVEQPTTSCIAAVRPQPTSVASPVDVVMDLPPHISDVVGDLEMWSGSEAARVRPGVPAPPPGWLRRGSAVH